MNVNHDKSIESEWRDNCTKHRKFWRWHKRNDKFDKKENDTKFIIESSDINCDIWNIRDFIVAIKSTRLYFFELFHFTFKLSKHFKKKIKIIDTFKVFVNLSLSSLNKRFDKYFIIWTFDIFATLLNRWNSFQKISKFLLTWYKLMSLRRALSFESISS